MIGVNLVSIFSMIFMCLCNLNARFTPISLKKSLIPHSLVFYKIRRKTKQSDGRNQVEMKFLESYWLASTKDVFVAT